PGGSERKLLGRARHARLRNRPMKGVAAAASAPAAKPAGTAIVSGPAGGSGGVRPPAAATTEPSSGAGSLDSVVPSSAPPSPLGCSGATGFFSTGAPISAAAASACLTQDLGRGA